MASIAVRSALGTAALAAALGGCAMGPEYAAAPPYGAQPPMVPVQPIHANPILLAAGDYQGAWEQLVDVVDDYFQIEHEEPVRLIGASLTEGHLTTVPEPSPTIFEPWRHETGDRGQRWENTLQTMRRRAVVRMIPAQGGYWVDLQVFKELEDLKRPEHATAGAATFRYDDTLSGVENPIGGNPVAAGWISRGRDTALEQQMIADLLCRCGLSGAAPAVATASHAGP